MTATILLIGIVTSATCVLLPGWGVKQLLAHAGFQWRTERTSTILVCFALGIHVNAITYLLCWALANPAHSVRMGAIILTIDIAIASVGLLLRKRMLPGVPTTNSLHVLAAIGLLTGIFAAYQFPNVLDSVQILQTQQFILGLNGGNAVAHDVVSRLQDFFFGGMTIPAQPGFGGVTFELSLLQPTLPVATVAAGIKPLLLCLAGTVSVYTARQLGLRPHLLAALLIFASLIFSHFGLYGLLSTGKDSVFAVLMALGMVASMTAGVDKSNEPGLFMSAAILQ